MSAILSLCSSRTTLPAEPQGSQPREGVRQEGNKWGPSGSGTDAGLHPAPPWSPKGLTCIGGAIDIHRHVNAPNAARGQLQCGSRGLRSVFCGDKGERAWSSLLALPLSFLWRSHAPGLATAGQGPLLESIYIIFSEDSDLLMSCCCFLH